MKAIIQDRYGEADVLEFGDVEEPVVGEHDVLDPRSGGGGRPGRVAHHGGQALHGPARAGMEPAEDPDPRLGRRGDGRGRRLGGDRVHSRVTR